MWYHRLYACGTPRRRLLESQFWRITPMHLLELVESLNLTIVVLFTLLYL